MEQRNNLVLHGTETFSRGALDNVALAFQLTFRLQKAGMANSGVV